MTTHMEKEPKGDPGAIHHTKVKPGAPASKAIIAALRSAAARLQEAAPAARDGEVEGIHRTRTSCRRLRSELRAFRDLVDPAWREQFETELKWLGNALGDVRDLDILREHLQTAVSGTGDPTASEDLSEPLKPLFAWLDERHEKASQAMREALQSERFHSLTEALQKAIDDAPLLKKSSKPCRSALPPLVEASWRRLKKGAEALKSDSPDPEFHDVRKRAKRTRYTAELIAPTLGRQAEKQAQRFIRLTTSVQDLLGEHQDMIVASTEVQNFLDHQLHAPEFTEAAKTLLVRLRCTADDACKAFFDLWPKLANKKTRRWLK